MRWYTNQTMDSLQDLLKVKADNIDTTHVETIDVIQRVLNKEYDGKVKVQKLTDYGVLILNTGEAPLASELRMAQTPLLRTINAELEKPVKSLRINIR